MINPARPNCRIHTARPYTGVNLLFDVQKSKVPVNAEMPGKISPSSVFLPSVNERNGYGSGPAGPGCGSGSGAMMPNRADPDPLFCVISGL